jgi:hypothetical protein
MKKRNSTALSYVGLALLPLAATVVFTLFVLPTIATPSNTLPRMGTILVYITLIVVFPVYISWLSHHFVSKENKSTGLNIIFLLFYGLAPILFFTINAEVTRKVSESIQPDSWDSLVPWVIAVFALCATVVLFFGSLIWKRVEAMRGKVTLKRDITDDSKNKLPRLYMVLLSVPVVVYIVFMCVIEFVHIENYFPLSSSVILLPARLVFMIFPTYLALLSLYFVTKQGVPSRKAALASFLIFITPIVLDSLFGQPLR